MRVYNTTTDYWAINDMKMGRDTMKIVRFLLDRGITAMKIYPFEAPDHYLSNQALEEGLRWIRDIRDGVGNEMDICVDCWGRFDFPSAERIAKALEPYNIMYLEDAMLSGNAKAYAQLAAETSVPICISETLASRYEYREFLELKACDVVMYDVTWCGGPSEAKKISDMAETYMIPTSPHTCGGPLLFTCSAHLATALPNLLIMESNYWKYAHQYPLLREQRPGAQRRPRHAARVAGHRRGDQAGTLPERRRDCGNRGEDLGNMRARMLRVVLLLFSRVACISLAAEQPSPNVLQEMFGNQSLDKSLYLPDGTTPPAHFLEKSPRTSDDDPRAGAMRR